MKTTKLLLLVLITFCALEWGFAQEIMFVETTHVQKAMREYQARYEDNTELEGYRIQYLFTTDRREMERIERKFDELYQYIPHEWEHDPPYYRLYAGSFVARSNAMQLLALIRENFPEALLINATVPIDKVIQCRKNLIQK
ncbi:hypothetical protein KUV50_08300 [Membranicola marinus]|uniref:Sporulation related domain-containing protein n=1 Tax=Membranihabitans marinus TaxID=1227546 RepID=A0A953HWZ1_9BACT|nr:hypothetical protein [Membranihabitans marinus]MBY5958126.1 hypothetical protein [Membranihabitans marinus]